MDFPYKADYAKSGRSSCRGCKSSIAQGMLRLAVMVQNPKFDAKTPNWYHHMCFFSRQRPQSTDEIDKFETLRHEDQLKIQKKIDEQGGGVVLPTEKGKGKGKKRTADASKALADFNIEYAKSGRATCKGCELKIMKDEIRISKKDYEHEMAKRYGGIPAWHHVQCFAKLRNDLGFFDTGESLPGFKSLKKDDKEIIKKEIPMIKQEAIVIKKPKLEINPDEVKQSKEIYKYRDLLDANLSKSELTSLLEANDQNVPAGKDSILDLLSDLMAFGALKRCEVCKHGQMVFDKFGYKCLGNLTEWTKCSNFVKEPKRTKFIVPKTFLGIDFLANYKSKPKHRIVKDAPPSLMNVKKEEDGVDGGPRIKRDLPALYDMTFVILGQPQRGKDELKKQITKLGGKVITKISETLMAVLASKDDVEKMGARITEAKDSHVQVVSEDFVDDAPKFSGKIPELILKKTICDWGNDPNLRLPAPPSTSKSKSKSIFTKSVEKSRKITLKNGTAVDPDSGMENETHVYMSDAGVKYTVVMAKTDIQTKKNSYYKLQLLQSDSSKNKFWVFRAWGRTGTTIGSNKLESFHSLHEAVSEFKMIYKDKTGNEWAQRHEFVKHPGAFYPVDVDYSDDKTANMDIDLKSESKLAQPVQNLIRLIFDVQAMKKVMMEFELDMEKMPLGKLSKKQIQKAFGVLSELQNLTNNGGAESQFIDASNRFYTFIPHSFGIDDPPIIRTADVIKQKLEMLDNLMELEIAYSLMSVSENNTIDGYYNQLNTNIEILDHKSEEFQIISEYMKNTHADTHDTYSLEIVDVFAVQRNGEAKRFKPFKKLPNHKLLWHGSRTTNFAGILAQGLRIAPPEAPVTGYMFGKGIYFADMVSKSANYCCTGPSNPTGLLLLCDVALGNEYEKLQSEYVEKLPKGKQSTKGVGKTMPDPAGSKQIEGIEVPCGKATTTDVKSSLLYNEYIVYDVAQVNVKYLLRCEFKYKY